MGRALAIAALAVLLNACATQTGTVVLLPEKDGKDAAVVVKQSDGQVVLSEPYAAAKLTTAGPQAYKSNPEEVQALFGAALAAQPGRPVQFVLFFVEGKNELTEESKLAVMQCSPRSRSARCPMCWSWVTPTRWARIRSTIRCRSSAPRSFAPD